MEKKGDNLGKINGTEAIVIHNGNIVLGMQKPKRWYKLENDKRATVIKTLGGQVEKIDENKLKMVLKQVNFSVRIIRQKGCSESDATKRL
mgnify:CR=1 FL=1